MTQLLERKQEETIVEPAPSGGQQRSWLRATLVVIAIMVVAAVGYAVYESARNGDGSVPVTGGDSNSVAIVNQAIADQLALRYPEPSSVDIINEQIALALLDSGPSSVEIVNEQIALAKLDTGPSSVEMVTTEILVALEAREAARKAALGEIVGGYQEHLRQSRLTSAWDQEYVAQYVGG